MSFKTMKLCLFVCFVLLVFVFLIIPIIVKFSSKLQHEFVFLTFTSSLGESDFQNPNKLGLYGTRNFYIEYSEPNVNDEHKVKLGVWHILPDNIVLRYATQLDIEDDVFQQLMLVNDSYANVDEHKDIKSISTEQINKAELYENILKESESPIVLYLHGTTGSRGDPEHRLDLYKVLRKADFQIISMDYRGYGDSGNLQPTEEGLVSDALKVYDYIRNITEAPILLWGHSLGTAISTHLLSKMTKMKIAGPSAVVLESAFTNMQEEIRANIFLVMYRYLPWFDYFITEPIRGNSLRFASDEHISDFTQPILMLHAEDDWIVPYKLGLKLYHLALNKRGKDYGPVTFHGYTGSYSYGHKYICNDPELPKIVLEFFKANSNLTSGDI